MSQGAIQVGQDDASPAQARWALEKYFMSLYKLKYLAVHSVSEVSSSQSRRLAQFTEKYKSLYQFTFVRLYMKSKLISGTTGFLL